MQRECDFQSTATAVLIDGAGKSTRIGSGSGALDSTLSRKEACKEAFGSAVLRNQVVSMFLPTSNPHIKIIRQNRRFPRPIFYGQEEIALEPESQASQ